MRGPGSPVRGEQTAFAGADSVADPGRARRARNFRRVGLVALAAVVAAAVTGSLGPTSGTATAVNDSGGSLEMEYPSRTRPGLDTIVQLTLADAEVVDDEVVLEVEQEMYNVLGTELVVPEPTSARAVGELVVLTFDPPRSRALTLVLSGRTPTQQLPGTSTFHLTVSGSAEVEHEVTFRTWVFP